MPYPFYPNTNLLCPFQRAPTLEERLKILEEQGKSNSVATALQALHRTLDKARFDPDDAIADLETLVRVAKVNSDQKAREYECILDEVQKYKLLPPTALKDLFVTLVGDPVKGKVLEKASKVFKNIKMATQIPGSSRERPVALMDVPVDGQAGWNSSQAGGGRGGQRFAQSHPYGRRPNYRRLKCFVCDSTEHLFRQCPHKKR